MNGDVVWCWVGTLVVAIGVGMSSFVLGIPVAVAWWVGGTACALAASPVLSMVAGLGSSDSADGHLSTTPTGPSRPTPTGLVRRTVAVGLGLVALATADALVPTAGGVVAVLLVVTCPTLHRAVRRCLALRQASTSRGGSTDEGAAAAAWDRPPTSRPIVTADLQATWRASYWALRTTRHDELLPLVQARARCLDRMASRVASEESAEWWDAVSAHTLPPVSAARDTGRDRPTP